MEHARSSAQDLYDSALETLRANRNRITEPRKAILEIITREHGPFTAEEIHGFLEEGLCDLVTVYRCLAAMEVIHLVRRCDFGDGSTRYEFDLGKHHHHHVICRECREVQTLDLCVVAGLEQMAKEMGYTNLSHTLEIFGVCPKCQKSNPSESRA